MSEFLKPTSNLWEFFSTQVKRSLLHQNLAVSQEVEYYLVRLLSHFAISENFFTVTDDGKTECRALALRLYDAVFDVPNKRFHHLKSLGDTSLYHAGVFYDGLFNQVVSVDYYISMGGQAYHSLANLSTPGERALADMFAELAERFAELVEIMKLSCETDVAITDNDVLRLIERYQKTGSEKAKKLLKEKGISPDVLPQPKNMQ